MIKPFLRPKTYNTYINSMTYDYMSQQKTNVFSFFVFLRKTYRNKTTNTDPPRETVTRSAAPTRQVNLQSFYPTLWRRLAFRWRCSKNTPKTNTWTPENPWEIKGNPIPKKSFLRVHVGFPQHGYKWSCNPYE